MSLSVEQVRQMREQIKANDAAKTAAQKKTTTQTAKATPAAPAAKSAGTGLSVAQVAQIRSQMTAAPASTSRLQTTPSTPAWTGGTRQVLGTVSADTLGKQVLADMTSDTGSPVATNRTGTMLAATTPRNSGPLRRAPTAATPRRRRRWETPLPRTGRPTALTS